MVGSKFVCVQVRAMVEGRDRRPELGFKLAMELKKELQKWTKHTTSALK